MSERLEILRPDDWHLHLRDGELLAAVLPHTAQRFARAIVMPNLVPPVTTVELARTYRERILTALPPGLEFEPLMTLYLTEETAPEEIRRARESGIVFGVKYYPAGATTHADRGVRDIHRVEDTFAVMAEVGLPLLVHGEVTDPQVDIFDREARFIDRVLAPLVERQPALRIVLEHVTTREGCEFVREVSELVAATITPQHLLLNRNDLFKGGLRPHHYCRPVLKAEGHRSAVLAAAVSGHPRFFLGTDSAPHPRRAKESACGCAGVFSAPAGLELYVEAFEAAGQLDRLEGFASRHGAAFYGLPRNRGQLRLRREPWTVPASFSAGGEQLVPLRAGETVRWQIEV